MKVKRCPKCGSLELGDRWVAGRKLQQYCYISAGDEVCGWKGTPRTPEKRLIHNTKELRVDQACGWDYIVYDKHGHVITYSRTYSREATALKELAQELVHGEADVNAGPYTGVLFKNPATVLLYGTMFKAKKGKVAQVK